MKIHILTHRLGIEVPCGDHRKKRIVIIDDLPSLHMNFQSMAGMLDMDTSFFQFLDDLLICLLISTSSGFDIGIYEDSLSDKIFESFNEISILSKTIERNEDSPDLFLLKILQRMEEESPRNSRSLKETGF